jgi:hypothetical protein
LPSVDHQVTRLVELGVHVLAGMSELELRTAVADEEGTVDALVAISPERLSPTALAPLLRLNGKPGFVVVDMADIDQFRPIAEASPPGSPVYLVHGPERGDDLASWSPDEALPEILSRGRTPLTLNEGMLWLLQRPDTLERNRCFMTIGSRLRTSDSALDARTPALWISNGTGRDGSDRRNAPKVGWCWAGNRHTWLGFASAARRSLVKA